MLTDVERFVDWAKFLGVDPCEAFDKADELLDHFGREHCTLEGTDDDSAAACMEYLNQGDTYALTLVLTDDYVNGIALLATSWGDWYEEAERQYCEEHGAIRCGYCGKLTDDSVDDDEDWRDIVCEHCGHNVSGG